MNLELIAKNAKEASYKLASLSEEIKNKALQEVSKNIEKNKSLILEANKKDLEKARQMVEKKEITKAAYNRLKLDEEKINTIIQGFKDIEKLEDPVNKKLWAMELDEGLELYKVSCPIGVIGVIFEARPDVVPQIASLAIKSANAVILKGGKEAEYSNEIFCKVISEALDKVEEFPKNSINLIKTREEVKQMLDLDEYIDLIIPRGGNSLVKYIKSNTRIPVLGHADGICHIYIDESADKQKAIDICVDAKIQYPSACNAVETILINEKCFDNILKPLVDELKKNEVKIKADEKIRNLIPSLEPATEEDWSTEYGEKTVSIKTVQNIEEAINHINKYGSGHTDCIITEDDKNSDLFMNLVDSAGVYKNASTRFADGFRYGLGAEVGISTNKTHARGPVGLEGLVIYKYKLYGNGQFVGQYSGKAAKKFKHKRLI